MQVSIKITSLFPKQKEIMKSIVASKSKYFTVKASRQSGKSVLLEKCAFYFNMNENNLVTAFIMANQKQLVARFKSMIKWIPSDLIVKANSSPGNMEILFVNGSSLMFYTAGNPDSIASNSFDYMFCDEFALWPINAWPIIQPTVAAKPNAKVIIVSTPRGKNEFYKIYSMGTENEYSRYESYDMIYTDNPFYDIQDVEEARKTFAEFAFKQEYLAEFIFGSSTVFGVFKTQQLIDKWLYNTSKSQGNYFGLDISGAGEDKTVLTIVNEEGIVVEILEVQSTNVLLQLQEIITVLSKYKNICGYGEKNGLGDSLCDLLLDKGINLTKWITTNDSKQELVSDLILALNENTIMLPTANLCPELDNEMSIYSVSRSTTGKLVYSHPSGLHDDYVMSLMLANKARKELKMKSATLDPESVDIMKKLKININQNNGYRL